MSEWKRRLSMFLVALFTLVTFAGNIPVQASKINTAKNKKVSISQKNKKSNKNVSTAKNKKVKQAGYKNKNYKKGKYNSKGKSSKVVKSKKKVVKSKKKVVAVKPVAKKITKKTVTDDASKKPKIITFITKGVIRGGKSITSPQNVIGDVKINAEKVTYNNANISGDLYVSADNCNVNNVTVKGTVYVNPGENGNSTLNNVTCGDLKVLSGGRNSIHLNNVKVLNSLAIQSKNVKDSVRIEISGDTLIQNTNVNSGAMLDVVKGSFGNVNVSNIQSEKKTVELKGIFNNNIVVKSGSVIKSLEGAVISKVQIAPENKNEKIVLDGKFKDVEVIKESKLDIADNSNIEKLVINAKSDLNISKTAKIQKLDDKSNNISSTSTGVSRSTSSSSTTSNDIYVNIRVEGYDHTIIPRTKVKAELFNLQPYLGKASGSSATASKGWDVSKFKGPTVAHVIARALKDKGVKYDLQDYGWSCYMAMVDGDREKAKGKMSGWMYRVNGELPNYGCQAYTLKNGDNILWYYGSYGFDTLYTMISSDKNSVKIGEEVTVTLEGETNDYDTFKAKKEPISDATILVNGNELSVNGKTLKTDSDGKAVLKFDRGGKYSITATRIKTKGKEPGYKDIVKPDPEIITVGKGSGSSSSDDKVDSISFDNKEIQITIGEIKQLINKIKPENASNKKIKWNSSDENIAKVDANGKVTGIKIGEATITATTEDGGKTATCKIKVCKEIKISEVKLNYNTLEVEEGTISSLIATVLPENATNKKITWKSSDENIARVDANGKVAGIKIGESTITATTEDGGKTASCKIKVCKEIKISEVKLNYNTLEVEEGTISSLIATVLPENATNKKITWKSSDENIARVDANGKVAGIKIGESTITATTEDGGKTASCKIKVCKGINISEVKINYSTLEVEEGAISSLIATVLPENATNKKITWKSSDENIAKVDANGKVTALKEGEATITVTTEDGGKTVSCKVKVTKPVSENAAKYNGVVTDAIAKACLKVVDFHCYEEWAVLGLGRGNRSDLIYKDYLQNKVKFLNDPENVELFKVKPTEYERVTLGVLSAGGDPTNVGGSKINLIEKICNADLEQQGINALVFGLIAIDTKNYKEPDGAIWTREKLIKAILHEECTNEENKYKKSAGWAFGGDNADPDMTGMAVTALAPYYNKRADVKEAIDRAVEWMSWIQKDDGGYASWGTANSESCDQVIMGLCALGIDPTGPRFTKKGKNVIDALLTFKCEDGSFAHITEGQGSGPNGMATEQALYALDQFKYFLEGKGRIYSWGENIVSDKDVKITELGTKLNDKTVEGDLYIQSNNCEINNVTVKGTIYVDPGKEGSTNISNTVTNDLKVLSGGKNSIHLDNVTILKNLIVDTKNEPVRVEINGKTNISNTQVKSSALLEVINGSFGEVKVSETKGDNTAIEFKGTFDKSVTVESKTTIKAIENTVIPSIKIEAENKDVKVILEGNIKNVEINKEANVELNGSFSNLNVNKEAKIDLKGETKVDTIKVSKEVTKDIEVTKSEKAEIKNSEDENKRIKIKNDKPSEGGDTPSTVSVKNVTLDKTSSELNIEETIQLNATVEPSNATNKKITWESSNKSIAKVDGNGKLTAIAEGTARITVTTEDGSKTAVCNVKVKEATQPKPSTVPVKEVKLDKTSSEINIGETVELKATVEPNNATNKNITWKSSNESIAKVDGNGKVIAIAEGTATITVTTQDGTKTSNCTITVKKKDSGTVPEGKKEVLKKLTDEPSGTSLLIEENEDNTIKILIESTKQANDTVVAIILFNSNNNDLQYIDQARLKDGKLEFNTKLKKGQYQGFYKVENVDKVKIGEFEVK